MVWLCFPDLGQQLNLSEPQFSPCVHCGDLGERLLALVWKGPVSSPFPCLSPAPVVDPPIADQQNFMVTLDQVLIRCLEHQQHWSRLDEQEASSTLQSPPQPGGPAPLLLTPHPCSASSLVFSCVSHALQWITQGRDPIFQPPSPLRGLLAHPTASSGASVLQEAGAIHVLVTGSLHLVGSVLKLLEPSLSQ